VLGQAVESVLEELAVGGDPRAANVTLNESSTM
jgi:hypothetical protein